MAETATTAAGRPVRELREALALARRLRTSEHPMVARTGVRMVAMIVETLYEVDVTLADPVGELE